MDLAPFTLDPTDLTKAFEGNDPTITTTSGLVFKGTFLGFLGPFVRLKLTQPTDGYTVNETVFILVFQIVSFAP